MISTFNHGHQHELSFFSSTKMRRLLYRYVYESANLSQAHAHFCQIGIDAIKVFKCLFIEIKISICHIFYNDYGSYDYEFQPEDCSVKVA